MGKPKVATVWLEGCAGCHMSFLDLDEALLDVVKAVDLTVTPITDFKDYDFPKDLTVGIIEGGVGNVEQEEIVHNLRKHCKVLIAWGDCAVFGGIMTMRNFFDMNEALRRAYIETESTVDGIIPSSEELSRPVLAKPVNQIVKVDIHLPGCPPSADAIHHVLKELLEGRMPILTGENLKYD